MEFEPGMVIENHVNGECYVTQHPDECTVYCEVCGDSDREIGDARTLEEYISLVILHVYEYSDLDRDELIDEGPEIFFATNDWGEPIEGKFEYDGLDSDLIRKVINQKFDGWVKSRIDEEKLI